ncbi:MAG: T9SS type A sorting domain-containing protein, partial [Calditrichota bacterium]
PAEVVYTVVPQVSWLTIQPSQMTIGPTDTVIVAETFSNNTPGNYSCYEIWTAQYFSWPEFTLWNLSVLTDISTPSTNKIPHKFDLFQNYPNPFNPVTQIRYGIPVSAEVKIEVYNSLGQQVMVLENKYRPAGNHVAVFDGSQLPSGTYFCLFNAGNYHKVMKMIMLK